MKITFKCFFNLILLCLVAQAAVAQSLCTQIAMNDQLGSVDNNRTLTFSLATLTGNDAEMLELDSFSQPASGMLTYDAATKMFTYTPAAGSSGMMSFNYTLKRTMDMRLGAPLMINGEEHYYEQVEAPGAITWQDAMMQAATMSYNGKKGYLVTITSAAENEYIRQILLNSSQGVRAWIGGSDAATEGTFRWVAGPEAGMPFTYTNWVPGEPNNVGDEDYATINTDGQWNDLANAGNAAAGFTTNLYFVEYGSAENCNTGLTAMASIMVNNVTTPTVPNPGSLFCTQVAMNDQLGSVDNNRTLTFSLATLTGNDAEMLELDSFSQPASGMLTYDAATKMFTYTPAAGSSGMMSFNYTLKRTMDMRLGAPLMINGEEHYYEQVEAPGAITWQDAMMQAATMSYNGKKGYLVTITSAAENEYIRQILLNSSLGVRAWIGGSDAAQEGTFRWETGPEAGMPFTYTNWVPGEPNNVGDEDYATINTDGQWNDLANAGNAAAGFTTKLYFVEYGSAENCAGGLTAMASIMVNATSTPPVTNCDLALTTTTTQAEPWWPMWGVMNGTGSIDLTVTGGTAPYTYKWNAGVSTQDLPTATPGMYSVMVTDANGCTAMTTLYVGTKNNPLVLTTSHINASMMGASNGSVNLSVIGGTGPYTFMWSNGANTEDLTGVPAGTYTVNVMDAMGNKATTSVVVSEPGMPLSAFISHQNVTKPGGYGSINLTPVGGVGPYTYKWNAGSAMEDLPQVVPGRYVVTITDATGATVTASVQVMGYNSSMMAMGGKNPGEIREVSLNPLVAAGGLVTYPNPVKNRATIAFNMTEEGAYQVDLYDIRGALVQEVGRGHGQRDQQVSFEFDAAKHAKGVYIIKLVTGKTVTSKRMVIEP